ncbi:DUF5302 family protein [Georgenia sp. SYP-B2076]|uniref:DUF5302 family protein n=1 Tax=Georgenia sp. SYP-B2076 TaxID=2495881 RepID=UPI000F8E6839|nr:DUF5302 family protein [Georgenia sp. SYP-B2076]
MATKKTNRPPDAADAEKKEQLKEKMRAALDRKQNNEGASRDAAGGSGAHKLHGVDHPVGPKQFRRKSGG